MHAIDGLIACSNLTGYAKLTSAKSDEEVFKLCAEYYEFVGDLVSPAGGKVIKFMGDAALMLFDEKKVDEGVLSLLALQEKGDRYMAERSLPCRHHIRAHFGTVEAGPLGTRENKQFDVIGSEVNTLFLLKSTGFALTAEAFRKLTPETRRRFKKHTPPITYIPLNQPH